MNENLLLTPAERKYQVDFIYQHNDLPIEVMLDALLFSTCQAQLDKILKSDWKDKPDSMGIWFFDGLFTWYPDGYSYNKRLVIVEEDNLRCLAVFIDGKWIEDSSAPSTTIKHFQGKWSKAFVPEVKDVKV